MIIDCLAKAIFLFGVYNLIALLLFGVPHSLSMTYYLYKQRKNILKILFPGMITLLVVFLLPCWLEISKNSEFEFAAFLSMSALMFVGACPAFLDSKMEDDIHSIAAIICAVFALLWVILVTPYWYVIPGSFVLFALLAFVTKTWKTCYTYWLEMVAFISTFIAIILYYLIAE